MNSLTKEIEKKLLKCTQDRESDIGQLLDIYNLKVDNVINIHFNKLQQNIIHLSCIFGNENILEYFWMASCKNEKYYITKDTCYKEPIHHACQHGNVECVRWLINNIISLNIDTMKKADWTPLMLTLVSKNLTVDRMLTIIELLLSRKANLELINRDGWTAFHLACKEASYLVVEKLFNSGSQACVTWKSYTGRTPLHTACLRGCLPIVELLLENGAKLNAKDHCGRTAVADAIVGGHIILVDWLLMKNCQTQPTKSIDISEDCDTRGRTLLHLACALDDNTLSVGMVTVLLKYGCNNNNSVFNRLDGANYNAVETARRSGNYQVVKILEPLSIIG